MPDKPFHHGNLRDELLRRARVTLRDAGADGLSLRQLARETGVSHGAPRRHFPERHDLLNALAERGFDDLTAAMVDRVARADGEQAVFGAVARTYIDFAVDDPALMDLMFSTKNAEAAPQVAAAADRFFTTVGAIVQAVIPTSDGPITDGWRVQLLLVSTLHGVASLVGSGRLDPSQVDQLVADASVLFGVRQTDE